MTAQTGGGLDGIPLLKATWDDNISTFSDKIQEARSRVGRYVSKMPSIRPSFGILKPSFLDHDANTKPPHPTAWLDGLRGVAAYFVFVYHFIHLFHRAYRLGYGSNDGKDDYWLIQLPVIRLVFTGSPMVSIFWVLSGISLSLKPIHLMRNQTWNNLFDTMFSSVFRRMLRLYLPVLAVQLCVLLATLLGLYDHAFELAKDWPFDGTNEQQHKKQDNATATITDWSRSMWHAADPFSPKRPDYDPHLWTIGFEFRNSIVLFVTLVGFSRLRSRIRVWLTLALYFYLVVIEKGDAALFIAGMGLAEFLVCRDENAKQLPTTEKSDSESQSIYANVGWTFVHAIGLHLLSIPQGRYETTPGYVTLVSNTPHLIGNKEVHWQRIGAGITLFGLCGAPYLRKPFASKLAVYLGKISFPLYIVHGPIIHLLGYRLVPFFWSIVGKESLFQYEVGVTLALIVLTVVVVWVADIVMRAVDTPSVRFGRWLQSKWSV